ncbi:GDCCVxC domain-containing (seleno)protein [Aggregatilineales bacterium SYSU G02658]
MKIKRQAKLICPVCAAEHVETMPEDYCQFFYECSACHARLRPAVGDCCVYCSYADTPCPPKQAEQA